MSATAKKAIEAAAKTVQTAAENEKPARSKRSSKKLTESGPKQEQASAEESSASTQDEGGQPSVTTEGPAWPLSDAANPPAEPPKEVEKVEGWDFEPAERPADVPKTVEKDGVKQVTLAVVHNCPATLAEIEVDIKKQMVNIANSFLRIGGLLIISREFFDKQDKFLAWADSQFQIKKAQVYKLMKVHQEFGEDARFKGVAMRVLDMLTGQPVNVKEAAAQLAKEGQLQTKTAEALIEASKPVIDAATGAQAEPLTLETLDSITVINPAPAGEQPDGEPAPAGTVQEAVVVKEVPAGQAAAEQPQQSEVDKLLKRIDELMESNAALQAQLNELNKPKTRAAAAAPMLKQFRHEEANVVLGISEKEAKDKKAIKSATRELSQVWNDETNKEAWALIKAASDKLLAAL